MVAVAEDFDFFLGLAAVFGKDFVEVPLQALHLLEMDLLVSECRVADSGTWLVDHESRVLQSLSMALFTVGSNDSSHRCGTAEDSSIYRRFYELHHRYELKAGIALTARRIDVKIDRGI